MNKKRKNKEILSRRGFFKEGAKGALPIIAGISLSGCSFFLDALSGASMPYSGSGGYGGYSGSSSSSSSGCGYTCSGGCSGGCDGTCQWGCETTCRGSCTGSSVVIHYGD